MATKVKCPFCGSTRLHKFGIVMLVSGAKKRVKCVACGHVVYENALRKTKARRIGTNQGGVR